MILSAMNTMLKNRWLKFCEDAGLDGGNEWQELSSAYGEPTRAYHNLHHIGDCLLRLDEHAHPAIDPVAVEFAIWFHDIVYDSHASDNEERSAVEAAEFLSATTHGAVVADLIRATRHDGMPGSSDAALLCDIDLSILGRPPAAYDAYARAIRQEYAWVPLPDFVKGRTRVLESFLVRSSVFALEEMEKVYGAKARANLVREISTLANLATE
jgi:predicted metal-dependent HD superfamily phosphohydrolase